MSEIPITSLPPRLQRQVENARTAIDRGNAEYAINICREILLRHPGCLAVRRVLRAAQQSIFKKKNRLVAKGLGAVATAPVLAVAQGYVKRDPPRAMDAAEKVLSADPTSGGALKLLARAAMAASLPDTAVFALEALYEQRPSDREVATSLARAYIEADRSHDGMAIVEQLLARQPGDTALQELLKQASVAQSISKGRWDSGSGTYRDKLRNEDDSVLLEQSAKAIVSDDMAQRLIDQGLAAIAAEPDNLRNYLSVMNGYRTLGRYDEALDYLSRARKLPVAAGDPTLERTEFELKVARLEKAVEDRQGEVLRAAGDPSRDERLIELKQQLHHTRITSMKAMVEKYPTDLDFKFELGRLHRTAGEIDSAIQQFQSAQRSAKLRIRSLTELGACFQAKGLYDLAVQQYETAKSEINGIDETKKSVVYELATCYEAMGQDARAMTEYKLIYSWDIGFRDVAAKVSRSYPGS